MAEKIIPLEVAQHTLWHYGDTNLGIQPSRFFGFLLQAFSVADVNNRAGLSLGFEDYATAFAVARFDVDGIPKLRTAAWAAIVAGDQVVTL